MKHRTGTSGGLLSKPTRRRWEKNMFADRYRNAKPFQRVMYGVLNIANSGRGIDSASRYDMPSFLILMWRGTDP